MCRLALLPLLAILALSSATLAAGEPDRPWTLLIYGAADNNADGPILKFLGTIRDALDDDPGMAMVLFIDRSAEYSKDATALGEDFTGARLYELNARSATRLEGGEQFPEITFDRDYEADSSDPVNLRKFIAWGKAHYPARHYALLIYSHADGQTMCPDEECGHQMGIAEVTDAVGEEQSVDFLALELCNMAGIEIAYQWRPGNGAFSADVLLAIPNAGPPLDWNRAFARIRSGDHATAAKGATLDPETMTAEQLGRLVIEEGEIGRQLAAKEHPQAVREAAACYDLSVAAEVKHEVDAFAAALSRCPAAKDAIGEIRGPGQSCRMMNYVGDRLGERAYVDLYDLCRRAADCAQLSDEARAAARTTMESVDQLVIASFGMSAYQGFEPGRNGVFIVLPDGDATTPGLVATRSSWSTYGWYTPKKGSHAKGPYGHWAWCADGATEGNDVVESWFELMHFWFDGPGHTGANGYRP